VYFANSAISNLSPLLSRVLPGVCMAEGVGGDVPPATHGHGNLARDCGGFAVGAPGIRDQSWGTCETL